MKHRTRTTLVQSCPEHNELDHILDKLSAVVIIFTGLYFTAHAVYAFWRGAL